MGDGTLAASIFYVADFSMQKTKSIAILYNVSDL